MIVLLRIFVFSIMLSTCGMSFCQGTTALDLNPNELKIFSEAKKAAQKGDYKKSNAKYQDLLKKKPDFTEGVLRLASNYFSNKDYLKAEVLFMNAIKINPEYDAEMYFSLAVTEIELKKYLLAAQYFDKYIERDTTNLVKVKKAKLLRDNMFFIFEALKNPVPFKPVSLGPNINSELSEYSPSLSLDGSTLIFTRRIGGQEDFYISVKDSLGFGKAAPMFEMNTGQNEGAHTLSADGKFLVFTACDRRDAFGGCDLYSSTYTNNKWSVPVNMGHKVNSAAWDSEPNLSPNGNTLYFSSTRKGTMGGSDIWMTYKNEKNAWVTPINLGPTINTSGKDETPFLHPDGQTLYFRSDARPGMGNFDIYYSRKDEKTDAWTTPLNIGYPINTEGSEGALVSLWMGKPHTSQVIQILKQVND
ncbi:MAG: PD40 domain-containing protein [Saprospiraceae bacterium]|nr:PD40 domain-containing protein [Saprospiraceae bacterium]